MKKSDEFEALNKFWPQVPNEQILADYKDLRRAKRAPFTLTVIRRMGKVLNQLYDLHGLSTDIVLSICCERGWQGLRYEWIISDIKGNNIKNKSVVQQINDRSWAHKK